MILPASEERNNRELDVVVFWDRDRDQQIRCAISREALDDKFGGGNRNKLEPFRENCLAIEEIARCKYLSGSREADGTFLIFTTDISQ